MSRARTSRARTSRARTSRGRVITTLLLLAAAFTGAQVGAAAAADPAPPCALNGVAPVPEIETAKAHFLKGEYPQFYRVATPFVADAEARYGDVMGKLPVLFHGGFSACSTILQRRDPGGMVQEMTLFTVKPPGSGMMSLLLTSAPVDGEDRVIYMTFSSLMSRVLEEIH